MSPIIIGQISTAAYARSVRTNPRLDALHSFSTIRARVLFGAERGSIEGDSQTATHPSTGEPKVWKTRRVTLSATAILLESPSTREG